MSLEKAKLLVSFTPAVVLNQLLPRKEEHIMNYVPVVPVALSLVVRVVDFVMVFISWRPGVPDILG